MSRGWVALGLVVLGFVAGWVKRCDPGREHSIYYRTKGRRD